MWTIAFARWKKGSGLSERLKLQSSCLHDVFVFILYLFKAPIIVAKTDRVASYSTSVAVLAALDDELEMLDTALLSHRSTYAAG